MAENDQGQDDRTEEPTAKRLRESREQGQIPRSRELNIAITMICTAGAFLALSSSIGAQLLQALKMAWSPELNHMTSEKEALSYMGLIALLLIKPIVPIFLIALLSTILAHFLVGGFNFSPKSLELKWERVSPLAGFKKLYSMTSIADVFKSLLRIAVIAGVALSAISAQLDALIGLSNESDKRGLIHAMSMSGWIFFTLCCALGLIALVDVPFQLWNHRRQLRMTKTQVRDEMKESEGNPEVKSKIRQLQREMSHKRMLEAIPTADVLLVNPTHFAVALKYQKTRSRAPVVVAKGQELIAQTIRDLAEQHKIPVVSAPPLTRALFRSTEVGQEIPVKLYQAVAQVLVFVYQLRQYKTKGGKAPTLADIRINEDEFGPRQR